MNRSRQIREVFHELRRSVGNQVSARELLECAASLVELFDDSADTSRFELRTGGIPFEEWPLTSAFADGGWRVMNYEHRRESVYQHSVAAELRVHNGMARLSAELYA